MSLTGKSFLLLPADFIVEYAGSHLCPCRSYQANKEHFNAKKLLTSNLIPYFTVGLLALRSSLFAADQPFYEGKTIRFIIRRIRTTAPRPVAKTLLTFMLQS